MSNNLGPHLDPSWDLPSLRTTALHNSEKKERE